ncbi:MAG TPA: MBL fold metallo-hydrolase [Anaerolinea sp.]|nr:MBL fold metallo-hydrolase [Anaerolinea sp.]
MEITWYGHSCFRLTERGMASVVTDPYDHRVVGYEALKLRADIVTVSHDDPAHNFLDGVKGTEHVIRGPGEFEIGGVFVTGIQTNHREGKEEAPRNTLYVFEYNGINIAHLGELNHVPTQAEIEALGTVHVALVPVGDEGSLNATKAAEVISLIEPNYVIPMHYQTPACTMRLDPVSKFLKEMGLGDVETLPSLKIAGTSGFPEDSRVVILDYPRV